MSLLPFLHLLAVGAWMGCVAVEVVIERSRGGGSANRARAALLHYRTDVFVEAPLFTTVLVTGALLLDPARFGGLYAVKVLCGAGAVLTNAFSLYPVIRRKHAADRQDDAAVRRYSKMLDATVPVGVPLFLVALGIGMHLRGVF